MVAVSKTKPVEDLQAAYEAGQRHFGENYVDEFVEKAGQLPIDINWHFIGHLQSNKIKKLITVPNLVLFETVDSEKLAGKLNKELTKLGRTSPLSVLVQVNTSGETTKAGVTTEQVPSLVSYIRTDCPMLRFNGLMAMGALNDVEGFRAMATLKTSLVTEDLTTDNFILSMGTSVDYELAIQEGASEVRLGSTIFGARNYPAK